MDTILKNLRTLVNNSVIKFEKEAKKYEDLYSIQTSDEYISAIQQTDQFNYIDEFTYDVIRDARITEDPELITEYALHPHIIPKEFHNIIMEINRKYIINNYIESNDYYRMLNGLPSLSTSSEGFIKLTDEQQYISQVYNNDYIHNFSDNEIYKLEESGIMQDIINNNPNFKYLNFLGNNKIDIVTARLTHNFGILKVNGSNVPDDFYNMFLSIYEENREYFMTIIYNSSYAKTYKLYDNFIGLCIMFMTIQRVITKTFESGIQRDFYDWTFIQNMYKMYNVPFINSLPIEYQVNILKNLNHLLTYKSTDKVIFDIASLLGYERMKIFKYYLVKEHKTDQNGDPIFIYKPKTDDNGDIMHDDDGNIIYEEDKERMYDHYFQRVDLNEKDEFLALQDENNKLNYNEVILDDPYWWEDSDVNSERYDEEFNYIETKYLGLNMMYKMTEMIFEITYLFRMIIDHKVEVDNIKISLPKLDADNKFSLFNIVVFLISIVSKQQGFVDSVITDPSKISHIYGFNYTPEIIEKIKTIIIDNSKYIDQDILKYFNNLEINSDKDIDILYEKIKEFNTVIIEKMRQSQNITEYNIYKTIFNIIMVSETQNNMFNIEIIYPDGHIEQKPANTYTEYLEYKDPILADIIKNTDKESTFNIIDHIISELSKLLKSSEYLFIINNTDSNNPIFRVLQTLINFFKSYTTDLASFSIIYLFDSKYYNLIKMIEDIKYIDSYMKITGSLNYLYADDSSSLYKGLSLNTVNKINDEYNMYIKIYLSDELLYRDKLKNMIINIINSEDGLLEEYIESMKYDDIDTFMNIVDDLLLHKVINPKTYYKIYDKCKDQVAVMQYNESLNGLYSTESMLSSTGIIEKSNFNFSDKVILIWDD